MGSVELTGFQRPGRYGILGWHSRDRRLAPTVPSINHYDSLVLPALIIGCLFPVRLPVARWNPCRERLDTILLSGRTFAPFCNSQRTAPASCEKGTTPEPLFWVRLTDSHVCSWFECHSDGWFRWVRSNWQDFTDLAATVSSVETRATVSGSTSGRALDTILLSSRTLRLFATLNCTC